MIMHEIRVISMWPLENMWLCAVRCSNPNNNSTLRSLIQHCRQQESYTDIICVCQASILYRRKLCITYSEISDLCSLQNIAITLAYKENSSNKLTCQLGYVEQLIPNLYLVFLQHVYFLRWGGGMALFSWKLDWKFYLHNTLMDLFYSWSQIGQKMLAHWLEISRWLVRRCSKM